MKYILFISIVLFSINAKAQKGDTLTLPINKYKFIKIGEKIYKVVSYLEEVKEIKLDTLRSVSPNFYLPFFPPGRLEIDPNSKMMPAKS